LDDKWKRIEAAVRKVAENTNGEEYEVVNKEKKSGFYSAKKTSNEYNQSNGERGTC
jgi:uncharacterized membrane protein